VPDPDDGAGQAPAAPPPDGGRPGPPARAPRPRPSFTAAEVLVGLGALSLVAAVAVFAAVSWSDLAAWAQGGLIVGLTGVVLAVATACRRRHLVATSEALGAVGVALGLADVQVARVGLDGVVGDRSTWAVGIAVVAIGAIALGHRTGIRVLGLAGGALAFAPLVVAAGGGRPLAWIGALAVQAVAGGAVAARLPDRRLDRAVATVGAALSWTGAVVGALGLATAGLLADPPADPLGPALVLAVLAVATVVGGRRLAAGRVADVVGGAGTALALVPAVLVALGFGSSLGVLAVVSAQALVAVGLGRSVATGRGERAVALVGGTASWAVATGGLLVLAVLRLVDGDPVTGPALVLAALAAGSVVVARRSGDDVLGAAGSTIAFLPVVLAAVAAGSPEVTLAVLAAQATLALALAASGRLTVAERGAATAGGATCWALAAAGSLVLAGEAPVVAAAILAGLAVCSVVLARRSGDDVLAASGSTVAFAPAVVLSVATGSIDLALAVVAAQAIVALALAASGRLTAAERGVATVGGATSWTAAVLGALTLGIHQVVAGESPVVAAAILAGLAVCSIVLARRSGDAVLAAAASTVAFAPAVLLAVATGSIDLALAVVAAQGMVALALAASGRLTDPERRAAVAGGATCWGLAATSGLGLGVVRLLEGTSPVVAAAVLAGLAVGSLVLARRSDDDLLAVAGSVVAFAPAVLLTAATGSVDLTLAVVAGQAVLALALAASGRLTAAERTVARAGGWTAWVAGASGALLAVLAQLSVGADDPHGRLGALLVLGGLAVGSVVVGARTERPAQAWLTAAGAGLAFVPVPVAALGAVTPTVLIAVLVGEALAAGLLATVVGGPVRTVLRVGGVVAWVVAVGGAGALGLAGWLATPATGPAGSVALLAALMALAVGTSLRSRWDPSAVGAGLASAVVPALLAVALAAGGLGFDGWVASMLIAAAVVAVGTGVLGRRDEARPWSAPSAVALVAGAALAVVPARTVLAVGAALVDRATTRPDVGAGVQVAGWLGIDAGWAVVAQVAGAAGLTAAVALLHRRAGRVLGALVGVGALVVVPVATGLTVGVTVAGLGAVVVAAATLVRRRPRNPELLAGTAATVLVGTAVAVASAPWAVGWTVLVGLVVAGLAVEVVVRRSPDAPLWVGTAGAVVLGGVALDAWVLGVDGIDGLLAVAVAAAAMAPVAARLDRRDERLAADVVDGLVALVLGAAPVIALAATGTVFSASPFLAVVGVTAGGAALRPRRRPAWFVATASAVLLAWLEAGRAELYLVEAYTVPLAAWALLVGGVVGRGRGSWERFGIGLLAAAGPTTVLALVDPDPVRTVAVVVVGAAVAVWGAAARLQAPLAVGAAAVGALAVRHLGPVGVELPRYVAFAVAGLVLVTVGATFEQRRQDLRHARDAFVRLR
jgi:hypothetical protein